MPSHILNVNSKDRKVYNYTEILLNNILNSTDIYYDPLVRYPVLHSGRHTK